MGFNGPSERLLYNEQIRAIYGSVLVERAPHLHAGLCREGAETSGIEVAQVLVVSQPPTWPWVLLYSSRKNGETPGAHFHVAKDSLSLLVFLIRSDSKILGCW